MPRQPISLAIADLSAFSRALESQIAQLGRLPRHLELMNMLARAAGAPNLQGLKAAQESKVGAPSPAPAPLDVADPMRVARASHYFGAGGIMVGWPSKPSLQTLCLWVLWSRLDPDALFDERGFSAWLDRWHSFGDAALIRREMWSQGLIHRTPTGTDYRRLPADPPPELAPLLIKLGIAAAVAS